MVVTQKPYQYSLALKFGRKPNFKGYYIGDNQAVVSYLKSWYQESKDQCVYLWGMKGSGKTHLLQAACYHISELGDRGIYLPLQELQQQSPDTLFDHLEKMSVVCLDDLQLALGQPIWEEAIFHCYNRIQESGGRLLIAADRPPYHLKVQLKDLQSRLTAGLVFQLKIMNDRQKGEALRLRAKQRGLMLSTLLVEYIINRCQRDMNSLMAVLDKIDQSAWSSRRKLTIPFVKEVMGW